MLHKVTIDCKKVYPIGIGTWNIGNHSFDEEKEIAAIKTGISAGAQVIDTAEMYGEGRSEKLVGKAIQGFDRESLYLISKVLPENASQTQLIKSLDQSLKRLKVDFLDMYLLHWKSSIPIEETIVAMEKVRESGKIGAWGVSNFDVEDLKKIKKIPGGQNCQTNQVKYNILNRGIEYDLLPYMQKNEMPLIAYSPVIKGDFINLKQSQQQLLTIVADRYQVTIPQLLLAWSIRNHTTISIPKSSNPAHMLQNIRSAMIQLKEDELNQLDQLFKKQNKKQALALW